MAENNERAELKGTIAGQSFSLNTKDIIPVLLLLGGIVCGYLAFVALDRRITTLLDGQERVLTAMATYRSTFQDALAHQQATIVEHATEEKALLLAMDQAHKEAATQALVAVQHMLRVSEFNRDKEPSQRVPLDLPLEIFGKPKP
jgi:hypothetical protein